MTTAESVRHRPSKTHHPVRGSGDPLIVRDDDEGHALAMTPASPREGARSTGPGGWPVNG